MESKLSVQLALNRQLKDEVKELEGEIKENSGSVTQGNGLRDSEHNDYLSEQKQNAHILTVLNNAVGTLNKSASKEALMQVSQTIQRLASQSSVVTDSQRDAVNSFAQKVQFSDFNNPSDNVQDTQGVMQVLKDLTVAFQQNIGQASDEERQALGEYDGLIRYKKNSLEQLQTAKDGKDALLAEGLQKAAQLKRSLADAEALGNVGESYLRGLKKICADSSNEYFLKY